MKLMASLAPVRGEVEAGATADQHLQILRGDLGWKS